MIGYRFTWECSRGRHWVEENLDRYLANSRWLDVFPSTKVLNEDTFSSDHTALILELGNQQSSGYRKFRFENSWIGNPEFRTIINQG